MNREEMIPSKEEISIRLDVPWSEIEKFYFNGSTAAEIHDFVKTRLGRPDEDLAVAIDRWLYMGWREE